MLEPNDTRFDELPLAAKQRIDAVCSRFEEAWRIGPAPVEDFVHDVPEAEQPVLLAELLYIDVERRRRRGENPVATDYLGRFPGREAIVCEVLPGKPAPRNQRDSSVDQPTNPGYAPPRPVALSRQLQAPGYEVLEEIGRGGMGVVYRARHLALNRLVALKFILGGAALARREQFRREAETVVRLRHPNIVQIYDIGENEEQLFLALEYAEGGSLAERLAGAPMEPQAALLLLEPVARAVQHAHRQGVIHRDLKPANILLVVGGDSVAHGNRALPEWQAMVVEAPNFGELQTPLSACTPKLTDFGLAVLLDAKPSAGEPGIAAGTPSYMSPEQAAGGPIGPAADVWALGAILYEMLTARPPFRAASTAETLRLVLTADPIPPGQLQPSVPRDLDTICMKCLQKEPTRRYPGARELAQDLRHFLAGEAIMARPAGPVERVVKWVRRRPAAGAVVFLLLLGVLGGAAALFHTYTSLNRAVRDAQRAQQDSDAALQREQENFVMARDELSARLKAERDSRQQPEEVRMDDALAPGADAGLIVHLAEQEARRGRWHQAAHLYSLAAHRGALYAVDRRRHALVRLWIGDRKTYARLARDEFARCRPGMLSSREVCDILLLCAVGAEGINDSGSAEVLSRQVLADLPARASAERKKARLAYGAIRYRAGRWREVIEALTEVDGAAQCALLAMAYLQEGNQEQAQRWLKAMRRERTAYLPFWERLSQDLFCREAENLFAGKAASSEGKSQAEP